MSLNEFKSLFVARTKKTSIEMDGRFSAVKHWTEDYHRESFLGNHAN
jgi:hypothetical protein